MPSGLLRCCGLLVVALALAAAPAAAAPTPAGFFGIVPQGPLSARDLTRMDGVVGTLRVPLYWSESERIPGEYDLAGFGRIVGEAAARGIQVLPFVYGTPAWLEPEAARPPLDSARGRAAWAAFLRVLVDRYGPRGTFWRDWRGRRVPIRRWQVWNEPNFVLFWRPRPSPRGYARLLGIAARAIRSRDPGARIVAAGVAPVGAGTMPWVFLRRLYRVPGVRRDFDLAALHPYSSTVARLRAQIELTRAAMASGGDAGKPLLVSELGVASDGVIPSAFVRGLNGQASYLRGAFSLLLQERRRWRIAGVDWFTWQDATGPDPHCSFCQGAGLLDAEGRPKPAWAVFRRFADGAVR